MKKFAHRSLCFGLVSFLVITSADGKDAGVDSKQPPESLVPYLTSEQALEHTPLSGQGFRTTLFGEEVTVPAWDRRSFTAWQFGAQVNTPAPSERDVIPVATIYWWDHPSDNRSIFYGESVALYNDILFAQSFADRSFERVFTFNSYTVPVAQDEIVDGRDVKSSSLYWGYIRPGIGLGYREQIGENNDNLFALDWIIEPGLLYFGRSNNTGTNFVTPQDTFELRTRIEFRWDQEKRNILNMIHSGFAAGANLIYGHRANWAGWGFDAQESSQSRNYTEFEGYLIGGGRVPFIDSERHRLFGYLHAGIGHHLDRFSAERIGGGPNPKGDSFNDSWRPVLPGASVWEYFPQNYAIAAGEYRWEATFFTYLSVGGGVATLNPLRQTAQGATRSQRVFPFAGVQAVTGFLGNTRLTMSYNHNWGVVRENNFGANEIMLWIAGSF